MPPPSVYTIDEVEPDAITAKISARHAQRLESLHQRQHEAELGVVGDVPEVQAEGPSRWLAEDVGRKTEAGPTSSPHSIDFLQPIGVPDTHHVETPLGESLFTPSFWPRKFSARRASSSPTLYLDQPGPSRVLDVRFPSPPVATSSALMPRGDEHIMTEFDTSWPGTTSSKKRKRAVSDVGLERRLSPLGSQSDATDAQETGQTSFNPDGSFLRQHVYLLQEVWSGPVLAAGWVFA
ncbi:hypothetical protein BDV98DRAFT_608396 [Pterulicium gracile]|uniref:Uncharacterized protein n=1 Tax=Pterulicium gracile TaxID=1884261 RepID=A0A5C3QCW3_9AGAR|nr:hypothetical protein BDV98DRAFT_608396 [Pterula gracilis]